MVKLVSSRNGCLDHCLHNLSLLTLKLYWSKLSLIICLTLNSKLGVIVVNNLWSCITKREEYLIMVFTWVPNYLKLIEIDYLIDCASCDWVEYLKSLSRNSLRHVLCVNQIHSSKIWSKMLIFECIESTSLNVLNVNIFDQTILAINTIKNIFPLAIPTCKTII